MRDDPPLAPDWLRVGTDIIKEGAPPTFTTFNASFELSGQTVESHADDLRPDPSTNGLVDVLPEPAEQRLAAGGTVARDAAGAAAVQLVAVEAAGLDGTLTVGRDGRWQRSVPNGHTSRLSY
jgi:hypothetical protein